MEIAASISIDMRIYYVLNTGDINMSKLVAYTDLERNINLFSFVNTNLIDGTSASTFNEGKAFLQEHKSEMDKILPSKQ